MECCSMGLELISVACRIHPFKLPYLHNISSEKFLDVCIVNNYHNYKL